MPEGYGLQVLRRLSYSGCKVIALREYLSICLEAGVRAFPYDYPETSAGQAWLQMTNEEKRHKYALRPPSKRVNYQVLRTQYPFGRFDLA